MNDRLGSTVWTGLAAVNVTAILFGSTGLFGKLDISPTWIVAGRAAFAAAALLAIGLARGSSLTLKKSDRAAVGFSGISLAAHWLTFFMSVQQAGIAVATLTFATFPCGIVLITAFRKGRRPTLTALAASLVIIFAVALLVRDGLPPLAHASRGAYFGLVSAATFAIFSVISQDLGQSDPFCISFYQNATVLLVIMPALPFADHFPHAVDWFWLALLGTVATALSHQLYFYGLKRLPAAVCGGFASLEPVYAIIFAKLLFSEPTGPTVIASGILIIAASLALLFWDKTPVGV